jgi:hypothetical protein
MHDDLLGAEQHMRAVLDQRHEPQLREGALATACARQTERGPVRLGIGHIQARAI